MCATAYPDGVPSITLLLPPFDDDDDDDDERTTNAGRYTDIVLDAATGGETPEHFLDALVTALGAIRDIC